MTHQQLVVKSLSLVLSLGCFFDPPIASGQQAAARTKSTVKIDFGPETELRVLIDYVSQRFGIGILFDERIDGQTVTLKAPNEVPVNSLLPLLRTILKMKGFALVDVDPSGWKQVIPAAELASSTPISESIHRLAQHSATEPVTHAFRLQHVDPQSAILWIDSLLSPTEFEIPSAAAAGPRAASSVAALSQQIAGAQARVTSNTASSSRVVAPAGSNLLIVTDYVSNLLKIAKLLEAIDSARPAPITDLVDLKNRPAESLVEQLHALLGAATADLPSAERTSQATVLVLGTNRVIVSGAQSDVDRVKLLIKQLDTESALMTKTYPLKHYSAERLQEILGQVMASQIANSAVRLFADTNNNRLYAHASSSVQRKIALIVKQIDKPPTQGQKRIQMYDLENLTALELLSTLRSLQGQESSAAGRPQPVRPASN